MGIAGPSDAEQSSRERFEAWASRSKYPLSRWPHEQDTYVHPALNCAWQAWHARDAEIAEQAAEIARLREAVRDASVVLRYKGFNVVAWALRVPAVRRALEAKS